MGLLILFLRTTILIVVVAISMSMIPRKISYPASINFLSLMMIFLPVASLEEDSRVISLEVWRNMVGPKMLHILSNLKPSIESITMVSLHQGIE